MDTQNMAPPIQAGAPQQKGKNTGLIVAILVIGVLLLAPFLLIGGVIYAIFSNADEIGNFAKDLVDDVASQLTITADQRESLMVLWGQRQEDSRFSGLDIYRSDCSNLVAIPYNTAEDTGEQDAIAKTFCSGDYLYYATTDQEGVRSFYLTNEDKSACRMYNFDSGFAYSLGAVTDEEESMVAAVCKTAEAVPFAMEPVTPNKPQIEDL